MSECLWCYAGTSGNKPLCNACFDTMRQMLGITKDDIRAAKGRGFIRTDKYLLDKALSGLDDIENGHWLEKSIACIVKTSVKAQHERATSSLEGGKS